ncbi:unnamed protein product [Blepharisma stoltei]|uniref:Nudix hydrolase domain-containing protein n=1 Tax=Blepharisma stoltei TaxID=1481888 RepID=A0AAU9IP58_9CILI|nr:unnamed protein product [Blepharisma stoltei]
MMNYEENTNLGNHPEEIVLIVDEENRPIGEAIRKDMRKLKLAHRASFIFIKNSEGLLHVQKRVLTKDVYPGYFDPTTGGCVLASDLNDKEAALRELEEELGITGIDIEFVDWFHYKNAENNVWGSIYLAEWNGPVSLQADEVESLHMMSISEILERFQNNEKFCPDSMAALQQLISLGRLN